MLFIYCKFCEFCEDSLPCSIKFTLSIWRDGVSRNVEHWIEHSGWSSVTCVKHVVLWHLYTFITGSSHLRYHVCCLFTGLLSVGNSINHSNRWLHSLSLSALFLYFSLSACVWVFFFTCMSVSLDVICVDLCVHMYLFMYVFACIYIYICVLVGVLWWFLLVFQYFPFFFRSIIFSLVRFILMIIMFLFLCCF